MRIELKLNGETRYRAGWRGCLVLQVGYSSEYRDMSDPTYGLNPRDGEVTQEWRDASIEDLQELHRKEKQNDRS